MGKLIEFIAGTIVWLGLFAPALIKPLAALPVSDVLSTLFVSDYLLWLACVLAVMGLSYSLERWLASRRAGAAIR